MKRITSLILTVILTLLLTVFFSCLQKPVNSTGSVESEDLDELITLLGKNEMVAAPARKRILEIGNEAIEPLIEAMQNGKTGKIRAEAIVLLGQLKVRDVIPFLINEIQNEHSLFRSFAIKAAGDISDERVISPLASVVVSSDYKNRQNAINSLLIIGNKGQKKLAEIMSYYYCDLRDDIPKALIDSKWNPQTDREKYLMYIKLDDWNILRNSGLAAVKYLIEVLQCESFTDRNILEILAEKGCDECLSAVLRKLEKNSSCYDGKILARFGPKAADRIYDAYNKTEEKNLKETCFCALAAIKDERILDQAIEYVKSDDGNMRYSALQFLKNAGKKETAKYLAPLLDKKSNDRSEILEILGELKDPSSVPAIVDFINGGGDSRDIENAIYILGNTGDIRAADILYVYANHPLENFRILAYSALFELKLEKRQNILTKLMLADDLNVRTTAYKRLLKHKWEPHNDFERAAECLVSHKYFKCGKSKHFLTSMLLYDLESINEKIKIQAIDGLLKIKDRSSREAITSLLKSNDISVRYQAAKILQRFKWLPDSNEDKVRYYFYSNQISECLKMGEKGIPLLIDFIIDAKNNNLTLKINGLETFLTSQSSYWLPFLLEKYSKDYNLNNPFYQSFILNTWENRVSEIANYLSSNNNHVRRGAINVLGASYYPSAVKPLIEQLGNDESDNNLIMVALKQIGEWGIEVMMESLDSPSQQNKNRIIDALLCTDKERTIQKIKLLSLDNVPAVNEAAKNWLSKCHLEPVLPKAVSQDTEANTQENLEQLIVNKPTDFEVFTNKFYSSKIQPSDLPLLSKYSLNLLSLPKSRQRSYAAELLEKYKWSPATYEEEIAYYFAKQSWDDLIRMGEDALPYLTDYYENELEDTKIFLEVLERLGWQPKDLEDEVKVAIIRNDEEKLLNMKIDIIPILITFFQQMKEEYNISFIITIMGLKKDIRAVEPLLYTYDWNKSFGLKIESIKALELITGEKFRYSSAWQRWWESEKKSGKHNISN